MALIHLDAGAVIGDDEAASGEATVKWLRDAGAAPGEGRQQRVAMAALAELIVDALVAADPDA